MKNSLLIAAAALALLAPIPDRAAADPGELFPRPAELELDIEFWRRIYTEVGTDGGFIHDSRHLGVVYQVIRFRNGASERASERQVEQLKREYRAVLRTLATGKRSNLTGEQARVLSLWPAGVTNKTLRRAASHVRFQLGQADKFRAGLIRAGAWRDHIHQTFRDMGLPEELAALPHVESSFTPHAWSRVGAAGLWQFTRSTGRRYMRVDDVVDERLDPVVATVGAARLLEHNRQVTGSWPLALTAYNHGASGMRRAARKLGTTDIATIVRKYKSRSFGFASRNFYVSFLAALEIDSNPGKYFGRLSLDSPPDYATAKLTFHASATSVAEAIGVDVASLKQSNPALRSAVWQGAKRIPRGFELHVVRSQLSEPLEILLAKIPGASRFAAQTRDSYHKVRRGENLSMIARRYGVSVSRLASLNGLRSRHRIRTGQKLRLPGGASGSSAARRAPAAVSRIEAPPEDGFYTVRRGDALAQIAARFEVSEESLMKWNGLRNRNRIQVGRRLRVVETPETIAAVEIAEAEVPTSPPQHPQALVELTTPPSAAAEFAMSGEPVAPNAFADPEITLTLGSSQELLADPNDYSVAADGTIEIQAAETLGHYAEWLDVRASRLRAINHLRYGTPLAVGDRLRLDFARIDRPTFEARRGEHHRALQGDFFSRYEITGTRTHVVRRGDSIWLLAESRYDVPLWLVRQYNPDVDLGDLHAGAQLAIPELRLR